MIKTQLSETSKTETVFMFLKTRTNQLYPFETPHCVRGDNELGV
jgi:hypothetical protein